MNRSNFDSLLERYLKGKVTHAERVKIEAWLESRRTSEERNSIWTPEEEDQLFKKISNSILNAEQVSGHNESKRVISESLILRIAAGLLLLVVGTWAVVRMVSPAHLPPAEFVAAAKSRKVILSDGTIVWLNQSSVLRYEGVNDDGERRASLTGEGIFEVAKDAEHPFLINCGNVFVKVLGTSFHLKAGKGDFSIEVLTGKVNVFSDRNKSGVVAVPQERVTLDNALVIRKEIFHRKSISPLLEATDYNMYFDNTPMEVVIARMEQKFDVRFVLGDSNMRKCRITADFTDHSLTSSLEMLSELIDLSYKIEESTVALSGAGCQNQ